MRKTYAIKAMLYGITAMLDRGEIRNTAETYAHIRETVRMVLAA